MSDDTIPGTIPPREALDVDSLDRFLRAQGLALEGRPVIRQFTNGASNLTYLVRYANRDLVLRRPPFGHRAKSAHDMLREAGLLRRLHPVFPAMPRLIASCDDPSVLGAEFMVMERLIGSVPQRDMPDGVTLSADQARALCHAMLDQLVALHSLDPVALGLGDLGRGEGYVGRQLTGWSGRFRDARTDDVGDFEAVIGWLGANLPVRELRPCLIHNDFKLDNLVLGLDDPTRVVGILDWEMATLGDPLMDLGCSLAYWVEAGDDAGMRAIRRQPSHLPGMMTRVEIIAEYGARTGQDMSGFAFHQVFGLFRLAVIAQQIYARFRAGHAADPTFAGFGRAVTYLDSRCRALIGAAEV
jgi:aminoglycoside phosphotransferase (APT) family kinase protein